MIGNLYGTYMEVILNYDFDLVGPQKAPLHGSLKAPKAIHNLTLETSKISTSRHQTPDEGIETLCAQCATQEVLEKVL